MARRRTLGKKRKSYRKTRNKKIKKTVRKTRRMRGGIFGPTKEQKAAKEAAVRKERRRDRIERWTRQPVDYENEEE